MSVFGHQKWSLNAAAFSGAWNCWRVGILYPQAWTLQRSLLEESVGEESRDNSLRILGDEKTHKYPRDIGLRDFPWRGTLEEGLQFTTHNHGSVENGCISKTNPFLYNRAIFHWTMIMGGRVLSHFFQEDYNNVRPCFLLHVHMVIFVDGVEVNGVFPYGDWWHLQRTSKLVV